MAEKEQPAVVDKLADAYERMLERIHDAIEHAEQETIPAFRELLHKTRDNMVELGELTREEAHKVAEYLERDLRDAARYIAETGEDLKSWWRFDLDLMEQRMLDIFSRVADQTGIQLHNLAEQARRANPYRTGEIAGPGTLICNACGAETHLHKTGRIPPCSRCQATDFKRLPDTTDTD
ncbi:MAG: zinc ribbon-containing protein [Candidatus Thiosymbion ectosymbiont of Robbea hypermnestra]|nr:zinc ribbon-containing protein [Candidatus Thiosymbion ectosymbiont of Robbea hypermnestra]